MSQRRIYVDLDATDICRAASIAELRNSSKMRRVESGHLRNNRISTKTDFQAHYEGVLGEIAVSKHYGGLVDSTVTYAGDGGTDMTINGQSVQIKTVGAEHRTLWIYAKRKEEIKTQWVFGCAVSLAARICLVGFVSYWEWHDGIGGPVSFGYGDNWGVKEDDSHPPAQFHAATLRGARRPDREVEPVTVDEWDLDVDDPKWRPF